MSTIARPVVFADTLPKIKLRTVALVISAVAVTALLAQVKLHFGWSAEAITGATLGAVLSGAILGSRLGAISQAVYVVAGFVFPLYAGGHKGTDVLTGGHGGYLVGGIAAAFVVGLLAERLQDRTFLTAIPAMLFGSAVVYVIAVPWLAIVGNVSAQTAISTGLTPFVVGEGLKALVAGAALPIIWKFATHESTKVATEEV